VALCRLKDPEPNHDFLEISTRRDYDVFDDIFVCGYPGGEASLNFQYNIANMKTSPIIQHGKISAFLPADNATTKEAITTDIIGTGGSSGSPIILASDCKVIGIVQWVISSSVFLYQNHGKKSGISNIGLITGVANPLFEDIVGIISQIKSGNTKGKFTAHYSTIKPV
jgi:hypothetical protein